MIVPYVAFGTPSLKSVHDLIYKRGYGKVRHFLLTHSYCSRSTNREFLFPRTKSFRTISDNTTSFAWRILFMKSTRLDRTSRRPTSSSGHSSSPLQAEASIRSLKGSMKEEILEIERISSTISSRGCCNDLISMWFLSFSVSYTLLVRLLWSFQLVALSLQIDCFVDMMRVHRISKDKNRSNSWLDFVEKWIVHNCILILIDLLPIPLSITSILLTLSFSLKTPLFYVLFLFKNNFIHQPNFHDYPQNPCRNTQKTTTLVFHPYFHLLDLYFLTIQ